MIGEKEKNILYTSGLFDGEGTITLTRKNKFRIPVASVTSTTKELLNFLKENFGGTICERKTKQKENHSKSWKWQINSQQAIDFIKRISPYLKEPKKRARAYFLINNYQSVTQRNGKYNEEQLAKKIEFEVNFFEL